MPGWGPTRPSSGTGCRVPGAPPARPARCCQCNATGTELCLLSYLHTGRAQAGTAWPGLGGATVRTGTLSQGDWGPRAVPVPCLCHHWAPKGHAQARPDTELSLTPPWYKCKLYFQPQSVCPGHGQHIPRHSPALPAEPLRLPAPCPRCRKGSRSIRPFAAAAMCHPGPGGMQAMLSSRVASPRCLPRFLCCLAHCGLTSSAGACRVPGFMGSLPSRHHHPAPDTGAKWEQGSSPHTWPSLEAQTQRYLSRMRKSSTIRTMGRKMRSRLSISATSSSASTRR